MVRRQRVIPVPNIGCLLLHWHQQRHRVRTCPWSISNSKLLSQAYLNSKILQCVVFIMHVINGIACIVWSAAQTPEKNALSPGHLSQSVVDLSIVHCALAGLFVVIAFAQWRYYLFHVQVCEWHKMQRWNNIRFALFCQANVFTVLPSKVRREECVAKAEHYCDTFHGTQCHARLSLTKVK